ncbi:MAG: cation-transporting P-type ATPase, partial [Elusimicrobiota bacterium]
PKDSPWWAGSVEETAQDIGTSIDGLSTAEATERLKRFGANALEDNGAPSVLSLLLRQFGSPIVLILIVAAILSFAVHDPSDGFIILFIVAASGLLGFWQEFRAATVVASLVTTPEVTKALGIPEGVVPVGWVIGVKIHDTGTWEMVKRGELRMFSIQGTADRVPVEA